MCIPHGRMITAQITLITMPTRGLSLTTTGHSYLPKYRNIHWENSLILQWEQDMVWVSWGSFRLESHVGFWCLQKRLPGGIWKGAHKREIRIKWSRTHLLEARQRVDRSIVGKTCLQMNWSLWTNSIAIANRRRCIGSETFHQRVREWALQHRGMQFSVTCDFWYPWCFIRASFRNVSNCQIHKQQG